MKRFSWLVAGWLVTTVIVSSSAAFAQAPAAPATEETSSESGLDLTLRTKAAAMPATAADGSAMETPASHMILLDYDTGTVLASKAADEKMYPSSMTKMMTLYMIFDKLKQGTLSMDSQFTVSEKAWRMQGSKMFVPIGERVGLEDLIRGIAIQSGNDACMVVAEGLAGSEEAFATQMNDVAKSIGMTNSHFMDASGWPNAQHLTTSRDLATLASALIRDFPQFYHYFAEREFTYHGIRQFNRNLLLGSTSMQVDGLKTGHTEAAGYGITLSAKDSATGRRQVLVINGLNSEADRAAEGERLLSWGFHNFDNLVLFKAGQKVTTTKIWMGKEREIDLVAQSDIVMSIPKVGRDKVKVSATHNSPIAAPLVADQAYGTLTVTMPDGAKKEFPLVAAAPVAKLSFFGRLLRTVGL